MIVFKRFFITFLVAAIFIEIVGAVTFVQIKFLLKEAASVERSRKLEALVFKQQKQVTALGSELSELRDQLRAELSESLEKASKNSEQAVKKTLGEFSKTKLYDVPAIIKQWRPRLAFIECRFSAAADNARIRGSGLVSYVNGKYAVITNRHLSIYNGISADACVITLPETKDRFVVRSPDFRYLANGLDAGFIIIEQVSNYLMSLLPSLRQSAVCQDSDAAVGDAVIILGYPQIGALTDITATDGIISGREGDFYITSAKVERGDSGGAVILLKKNCYLGIPTFVQRGQLESLARILRAQVLLFVH